MKRWLLAALSTGNLVAPAPVAGDGPSVHVHLHVQSGIATDGLDAALRIASGLLGRAGVVGRWRVCTPASLCVNPAGVPPTITVIVRRASGQGQRPCGRAVLDSGGARGLVLVDYDCVAAVTASVSLSPRSRTWPHLTRLDPWEVVGLVMAHEIGHVAGVRHAGRGVMQARLDIEDLAAFRRDELEFSRHEAATLRAALASMVERTARRDEP